MQDSNNLDRIGYSKHDHVRIDCEKEQILVSQIFASAALARHFCQCAECFIEFALYPVCGCISGLLGQVSPDFEDVLIRGGRKSVGYQRMSGRC